MICNTHYGYCGGKIKSLEGNFTYTGRYNLRSDGVLELLSSGTFTPRKTMIVDVFLVGGGGGGASTTPTTGTRDQYRICGGGGGGGYTATSKGVKIETSTTVTIGNGGTVNNAGGSTSFGDLIVSGGNTGSTLPTSSNDFGDGGSGGSGGGPGQYSYYTVTVNYTTGGDDGGNGVVNPQAGSVNNYGAVGTGQGSTTREFGESNGKIYSGGGGGGFSSASSALNYSYGGTGAGRGASTNEDTTNIYTSTAGTANTGGGGGGCAYRKAIAENPKGAAGSAGGSGIVCIRLSA